MRRTINTFLLVFFILFCLKLLAQQPAKSKATKGSSTAKKIFIPPVYLGHSQMSGGPIKKKLFDSLLKQGLVAQDSLGNKYRIAGFDFSYAERSLYEDEGGNLQILTDFQSEYCKGDTLPAYLSLNTENAAGIYERTKWGDTAYFDRIRLFPLPGNKMFPIIDTLPILGRGMKFILVK
jgi:hypothetical protein